MRPSLANPLASTMAKFRVASLCILVGILCGVECSKIFGSYFPNWAQHRCSPYTYLPKDLKGIVDRLDHLIYAYAHFDPSNYTIVLNEANDTDFIRQLVAYRSTYHIKLLLSVGGHSFPSAHFSEMAGDAEKRTAFIADLKAFLGTHNFDGVDISWQYPCSAPKSIFLKHSFSCENMTVIHDTGGRCPDDTTNFALLLKEMREALGSDVLVTVAGPALPELWKKLDLQTMSDYVDYWYIMTFDYTIPTLNSSYFTAPNSPLRNPSKVPGGHVSPWNINNTVDGYIEIGVPPSKIIVGIPLYGHTWYAPGLKATEWKEFGTRGLIQGKCCGPLEFSYGAKYGQGSQICGTYMYSEIAAAGVDYYYETTTQTAIGYLQADSPDGWSEAGTWFTYSNKNSMEAVTQFINEYDLAGAFAFDLSQDSIDFSVGQFTYELMQAIHQGLNGGGSGNICNPVVGCTVCQGCCKSYLTNQFDCDACVTIRCN